LPLLGIWLALASAAVWGSGDFAGGLAARRVHPFAVLGVSALSGMLFLIGLAVLYGEPLPPVSTVMWAAAAGGAGSIGIAALYRGLAVGSAAVVAPTAAVLTAMVPVLVTATTSRPGVSQMAGFAMAMCGIWLVATGPAETQSHHSGLRFGLIAGSGFGLFLALIGHVPPTQVFGPLVVARSVMLLVALVMMTAQGVVISHSIIQPMALLAGALDAGGNVLYLFARTHLRLDVAAVLSSFYPVATVVLSRWLLHQPVSRLQWVGAAVCLISVALIIS